MELKQTKMFSVIYSIFVAVLSSCASIPSQPPLMEHIYDNHGGADIYAGPSESELVWTGHKTPFERTIHRPYLEARCYQLKRENFYDSEIICRPKQSINRMVYFDLKPKPIVTYEVLELENMEITYPLELEEFALKFGTWLNSVKPQYSKKLRESTNTFLNAIRERQEDDLEFICEKLQLESPTKKTGQPLTSFASGADCANHRQRRSHRIWDCRPSVGGRGGGNSFRYRRISPAKGLLNPKGAIPKR